EGKGKAVQLDRFQPSITQFVQFKPIASLASSTQAQIRSSTNKASISIAKPAEGVVEERISKIIKNITFKETRRVSNTKRGYDLKDLKSSWLKLKASIDSIYLKKGVEISLEELYKTCETLCIHNHGEYMYEELTRLITERTVVLASTFKEHVTGNDVLCQVRKTWDMFYNEQLFIRNIFLFLDRAYILRNPELKSVMDLGYDLFRKHFFNDPSIKDVLLDAFVNSINDERAGKNVSRELLRSVNRILMSLGVYVLHFEEKFLARSNLFYEKEAEEALDEHQDATFLTLNSLLNLIERRINEETERCSPAGFLSAGSKKGLLISIFENFIERRADRILSLHFEKAFVDRNFTDLWRLYCLLKRVYKEKPFKDAFELHVKNQGRKLFKDTKYPASFIPDLLSFIATDFEMVAKDALTKILDHGEHKIPQLLANHIDHYLKLKNLSTEDGEKLYCLAKRLLHNRCKHVHLEKIILSRLKAECGPDYTMKLEGMFKDMELSVDLRQKFESNHPSSHDVSFNVLTASLWPAFPKITLNAPTFFVQLQKQVDEFYKKQHSGRNLQWQCSLSNCVVKAKFSKGDKELAVSMIQASLLLLFNDFTTLSLKEIKLRTGLDQKEIVRMLDFLTSHRVRLLKKIPDNEGDLFAVNEEFHHTLFRVKLNASQNVESAEETTDVNRKVLVDRSYQIDAAIVRILKSRKNLSHSSLLAELAGLLNFPFHPADVKPRVESLIEREFIRRSHGDSSVYVYCA
ncbi:Cullin family-domain-containing protein, partial [Chytridium lagenaria]